MKKQIITLTLLLTLGGIHTNAQPQWKFHVAFEDATGARDTIWFIWDTTATFYGADTALGEVSVNIDHSVFSVWTSNNGLTWYDTIKIVVHPYDYGFAHIIKAVNIELPITVRWDSTLLQADWLPPEPVGWVNRAKIYNDYFFLYPNDELIHHFDMTLNDHVIAPDPENEDPWAWQEWVHFPMSVVLRQDPTVTLPEVIIPPNEITLYPNPTKSILHIDIPIGLSQKTTSIEILNIHGSIELETTIESISTEIDMRKFEPGVHFVKIHSGENMFIKKIIKQ